MVIFHAHKLDKPIGKLRYWIGKFRDGKLVGRALCRNKWEIEKMKKMLGGK